MFIFISTAVFAQDTDSLSFMIEFSIGYAVGVNLDNATFFDVKLLYPFGRFGYAVELGGILSTDERLAHAFLGPMVLIVDTQKLKVPFIVGVDLLGIIGGKTTWLGIGGIVAAHYSLNKTTYLGINFEATYAMNNRYEEIVGYQTNRETVDDGTGNAVFVNRIIPITEMKSHYGNNWYIKPSILIGYQH
jgi:hypothetical protein